MEISEDLISSFHLLMQCLAVRILPTPRTRETLSPGSSLQDSEVDSVEQSMKDDGLYDTTGSRLTIMIEQFRVDDSYPRWYGVDAGDEQGKETSNQREMESPAKQKRKKQK